jgi:hypothetical protein
MYQWTWRQMTTIEGKQVILTMEKMRRCEVEMQEEGKEGPDLAR